MHEEEKLDEAEYFLNQMASVGEDGKAYKYNVSAFLSAGRSVLQFAREEAKSKPGGQVWFDTHARTPVLSLFKDKRDVSIHAAPINPILGIQVNVEDALHFSNSLE